VECGKRPWWIGSLDRDGSVGPQLPGLAVLELEGGPPVDRDPIHLDLVIPAPVLAPATIPGDSFRFQLLWFRIVK
jgi:hypothetical protein